MKKIHKFQIFIFYDFHCKKVVFGDLLYFSLVVHHIFYPIAYYIAIPFLKRLQFINNYFLGYLTSKNTFLQVIELQLAKILNIRRKKDIKVPFCTFFICKYSFFLQEYFSFQIFILFIQHNEQLNQNHFLNRKE